MMIKEFCADYKPHESAKYRNFPECTVKIKTGDEIIAKDISESSIHDYVSALKDLGYEETFFVSSLKTDVDDTRSLIEETKKKIKSLQKDLEKYEKRLTEAEDSLATKSQKSCDWWYDCWTEDGN